MEEIYQLLNERLNGIRDLIQKFDSLQSQIDFDSTYSLTSQQINDLSTYIMNLRKNEKMRVLRENDYVEIILAYQNFEPSLRIRFQAKSYEIMQKLFPDFEYKKYCQSGEIRDISKVYLKFFEYLRLPKKIEELKRIYSNLQLMNLPLVAILAKWLIEISRKRYQDILKEKSNALVMRMPKGTAYKPLPERRPTSEKTPEREPVLSLNSICTEPSQSTEPPGVLTTTSLDALSQKCQEPSEDNHKKQALKVIPINSLTNTVKPISSQTDSQFSTKNSKPKKDETAKENCQQQKQVSQEQPGSQKPRFLFSRQRASDNMKEETCPKYVNINIPTDQYEGNCYDVIADLDHNAGYLYANHMKMSSGKKPIGIKTIDIEKKRELIAQHFKTLMSRNLEIERSINSYKMKLKEKNKIDYDPQISNERLDAYVDTITTASVLSRISHLIHDPKKQKRASISPLEERLPTNPDSSTQQHRANIPKKPLRGAQWTRYVTPDRLLTRTEDSKTASETPAPDLEKDSTLTRSNNDTLKASNKEHEIRKLSNATRPQSRHFQDLLPKNATTAKDFVGYRLRLSRELVDPNPGRARVETEEREDSSQRVYGTIERRALTPIMGMNNSHGGGASIERRSIDERFSYGMPLAKMAANIQPLYDVTSKINYGIKDKDSSAPQCIVGTGYSSKNRKKSSNNQMTNPSLEFYENRENRCDTAPSENYIPQQNSRLRSSQSKQRELSLERMPLLTEPSRTIYSDDGFKAGFMQTRHSQNWNVTTATDLNKVSAILTQKKPTVPKGYHW